jgi:hypothetical protein
MAVRVVLASLACRANASTVFRIGRSITALILFRPFAHWLLLIQLAEPFLQSV